MGYRSTVACLIERKDVDATLQTAEEIKSLGLFDIVQVNRYSHLVYCYVNDIKWYHDFEAVRKFYDILNSLDTECESNLDAYANEAAHFVRIGDDVSDVEEECYGDVFSYLDIVRSIGTGDFTPDIKQ